MRRSITRSDETPSNGDAERFILGAIFNDPTSYLKIASDLQPGAFYFDRHQRIFSCMGVLAERGEQINRVAVAEELRRIDQLPSVGGLTYLASLDEGMPRLSNVEGYIGMIKAKEMQRRLIATSKETIARCVVNDDPHKILMDTAENLIRMSEWNHRRGVLQNPAEIIKSYEGGMNAFLDPSLQRHGLSTGFLKLDEMTGGLRPGELFILAARPAMGKTALAMNIAQHVVTHTEKAVAMFSLEMSKESLLTRMLCGIGRLDMQRFRLGYLNSFEREALQSALGILAEAPFYLDDTAAISLVDMHAKLRQLQIERDLGLVIVDYLQLMQGHGHFENRQNEISNISRGLKLLAKDLSVPFLVLSQLSRSPELRMGNHRPMLSDLRDSGSIEQDADLVAFVFREELYRPDKESLKGFAELILAKQRNGPIGRIKLAFVNRYTRFENLANDTGIEPIEEEGEGEKPAVFDRPGFWKVGSMLPGPNAEGDARR
jgi:replicative DNA helicase